MRQRIPTIVLSTCVAGLLVAACGRMPAVTAGDTRPAKVEHLTGADPTRVTLTEEAAKRLDIQTATAIDGLVDAKPRVVVPYSAIIYDTNGGTWTYITPSPLTFVRHAVKVDRITGNQVFLSEGLVKGTSVVTIGSEELFGSESEFQEE